MAVFDFNSLFNNLNLSFFFHAVSIKICHVSHKHVIKISKKADCTSKYREDGIFDSPISSHLSFVFPTNGHGWLCAEIFANFIYPFY